MSTQRSGLHGNDTDDKGCSRTQERKPGGHFVKIKCLKVLMLIRKDRRLRSIMEQNEAEFWIWHPGEMESPVGSLLCSRSVLGNLTQVGSRK